MDGSSPHNSFRTRRNRCTWSGRGLSLHKAFIQRAFFELSTGNPQEKSTAYPQEMFMLQCYFLVRLAGLCDSSVTARGPRTRSGERKPERLAQDETELRSRVGLQGVSEVLAGQPDDPQGGSDWAGMPSGAERVRKASGSGFRPAMRRPRLSTWRLFLFRKPLEPKTIKRSGARLPSGSRAPLSASADAVPRLLHLCAEPYTAPRRKSTTC